MNIDRKIINNLLISFAAALIFSGAFLFGFLNSWQEKLSDKLFLEKEAREDILIIGIDENSLKKIGQWPWPRKEIATTLSYILKGEPKAIGIDINFSEPSRQGEKDDESLAEIISDSKIILPVEGAPLKIKNKEIIAQDLIEPVSPLKEQIKKLGHINVLAGKDGVVRKIPLFFNFENDKKFKAMSLVLAAIAQNREEYSSEKEITQKNQSNILKINFIGPPFSFKTISFSDVWEEKISLSDFKNKIILIGAVSPDLGDTHIVPTSSGSTMSGVEIHANALQTILEQKFLIDLTSSWVLFFIFLLSFLNFLIFWRVKKILQLAFFGFLIFAVYNLSALFFYEQGIIFNLVHPNLNFIFSFLTLSLAHYFSESKEKKFLRQSFGFYLAPEIIEEIIKNPEKLKLGGEKKDLTVLFSDIRGFTTLSEKIEPEILVRLLNEYFSEMTKIIFSYQGVVDKFIGDAIMAFWGAPQTLVNHQERALSAAVQMIKKLKTLNKKWQKQGLPRIEIGIGINSGEVIVGNMGSEKRFDYTVIGDNVNLASRLEGLNKQYQSNIIISEFTYQKIKSGFNCRYLDEVLVKGKEKPIKIYQVLVPR